MSNRSKRIQRMNDQIFDLVYYGHFSYIDCEHMTSLELKTFHSKLIGVKDRENQVNEELEASIKNFKK